MNHMRTAVTLALVALLCLFAMAVPGQQKPPEREEAMTLWKNGNYKEAYDALRARVLDADARHDLLADDLLYALLCLQQLNRRDECDELVESAVKAHADDPQLLRGAAEVYLNRMQHDGAMVAGEFQRGPHRGGTAKYVNSYERDRVRALQLMEQSIKASLGGKDTNLTAALYWAMAQMLLANRGWNEAWRFQYLTDLTTLPDYEEGYYRGWHYGRRGAPVDENGSPVLHRVPESWEAAKTDGERWRWSLVQAVEIDPTRELAIKYHFAEFLHNQFGVQTMQEYAWYFQRPAPADDDTRKDESGTYALHTLGENETIAKLANGIKRFKLPDEFNFVRLFQEVAAKAGGRQDDALANLARIFENRRQYLKAADYWKRYLQIRGQWDKYKDKPYTYTDPPRERNHAWESYRQILGNWGLYESTPTQPSDKGATFDFRFRNGKKVTFTANAVKVDALLEDLKAYLKSSPKQLDWQQIQIHDIGHRLIRENQKKYIGEEVAKWSLDLEPLPAHFDRRVTVTSPLQKPGAYLVTAQMDDGNASFIVLWVADTAIVKKRLAENDSYVFVADAISGEPVAKANVEFFGYRQQYVPNRITRGGHYVVHTATFAELTDADGQIIVNRTRDDGRYQWVLIARTDDGRFAYHGFTGIWGGNYYDRDYNQRKVFAITDRPVYRPNHTVKWKAWVNQAQYDREGKSPFAGQQFTVQINNPRGEKVYEKALTADAYGGVDGELTLEDEATLGMYQLMVKQGNRHYGGGSFRVEEYKKPEFEVTVDAPDKPVMLGETIKAKISATYYFGGAVTEGKVKYKILRHSHDASWYPHAYWDWLYEPGYWWFAYDYAWYPGWHRWGCRRPWPWWHYRAQPQPELVAEVEGTLSKDGTVDVTIDTAVAKALHGDEDHRYEITAEVTDLSRRTIVGKGTVLVARKPFKVYAWVDRGHYRTGDTVNASFNAQTLDNRPVQGKGELKLLKIDYNKDNEPVETVVEEWDVATDDEGRAARKMVAAKPGQYRISYTVNDGVGHSIEGGYVFVVRGEGFDGAGYRFNDLELIPDKKDYKPGEAVKMMVNVNRENGTVLLFVRPTNGTYLRPKVLRLKGKSVTETIDVIKKDMPNFFVEAVTVAGARVHEQVREVHVPPEKRVLDVKITPSADEYKPGAKAKVDVQITDPTGEPVKGQLVLTMYDKSVEYISGGSNVQDIKPFFWKWRRRHNPGTEHNLGRYGRTLVRPGDRGMSFLGVFGHSVADEIDGDDARKWEANRERKKGRGLGGNLRMAKSAAAPMVMADMAMAEAAPTAGAEREERQSGGEGGGAGEPQYAETTVRTQFADTALWVAALETDHQGKATVELTMPENLTAWKTRVWAMGDGTRVGEGTVEVTTTKNLIVRLQAPRFFVQKDEVVLSAVVHNYLKTKKTAKVVLELAGDTLAPINDDLTRTVEIEANGQARVDWRVKVTQPGNATVTMKALTDEESDAMRQDFPVYVHGMLKTESYSGNILAGRDASTFKIRVPAERRPEQTRLELRYSPTLAGAMVDALPYLVEYPYGCTEQTLNRFVPTVITQQILLKMGLDLKDIRDKRTNLNAQEIGDDKQRMEEWKRLAGKMRWDGEKWVPRNPVFDEAIVKDMVKAGIERLESMQCSDGGWGWFSGWGERSYPHTTAVVVHGLQVARDNDVALIPGMLERGITWLERYQKEQLRLLERGERQDPKHPFKTYADNLDAYVYAVLIDADVENKDMREHLYKDRTHLSPYALAMFGLACHKIGDTEKRDMLQRNIEQYLQQDDENQTAWLNLPGGYWWYWYGSEMEAHAWYLKLLAAVEPKSPKASRLVKYLINNRRHATYWSSTRDTALVIEALADYMKASEEDAPDMTLVVAVDGKTLKEVRITKENIFSFDNKLVLEGNALATGEHTVTLTRKGVGPVYYNAYMTNFTLEDPITKAGLEIQVNRSVFKLKRVEKTIKVEGARGQALDQQVEKYERIPLDNLALLKSGDLIEVELVVESKNDYEYIIIEDMKASGFEPVEVRSGYNGNEMGAYVEFRDERTVFFVRQLARGKHSLSYRLRAEIPGKFSALPAKGSAMYAPELKANSDEIKLRIED